MKKVKKKTKTQTLIEREIYGIDRYTPMSLKQFKKLLTENTKDLKNVEVFLEQESSCYCYDSCGCSPLPKIMIKGYK